MDLRGGKSDRPHGGIVKGLARATGKRASRWLVVLAFFLAGLGSESAIAQDLNENITVNYVYASQLGIGTYDIGGLSVNVFTLPLGITQPLNGTMGLELGDTAAKDWAIGFNLPVSLGVFDFSGFLPEPGQIEITQYTLAFVPGVELSIPVNENWRLRPFADLGAGFVIASESTPGADVEDRPFLVYSGGVSSLYEVPFGPYVFALGNGVTAAGNNTWGENNLEEFYFAIETGLQVRRSLGFTLGDLGVWSPDYADVEPQIGAYFIHYYFPEPLTFSRLQEEALQVDNQFEFGVTLRAADDWELFFLKNPKIGASYLTGDGLTVIRANFGFPF